eukprot:1343639-Pleurochrysis_carterae.AAC.6
MGLDLPRCGPRTERMRKRRRDLNVIGASFAPEECCARLMSGELSRPILSRSWFQGTQFSTLPLLGASV